MTTTAAHTLSKALKESLPGEIADALRLCDLSEMFKVQEYDSGTITATASPAIPGGALLVQSVQVVTSATGTSVGHYLPGNSASTPLLPPGGANTAVGICSVAADGSSVTLPNTVTRVIIRYIKNPARALTALFENLPTQ